MPARARNNNSQDEEIFNNKFTGCFHHFFVFSLHCLKAVSNPKKVFCCFCRPQYKYRKVVYQTFVGHQISNCHCFKSQSKPKLQLNLNLRPLPKPRAVVCYKRQERIPCKKYWPLKYFIFRITRRSYAFTEHDYCTYYCRPDEQCSSNGSAT